MVVVMVALPMQGSVELVEGFFTSLSFPRHHQKSSHHKSSHHHNNNPSVLYKGDWKCNKVCSCLRSSVRVCVRLFVFAFVCSCFHSSVRACKRSHVFLQCECINFRRRNRCFQCSHQRDGVSLILHPSTPRIYLTPTHPF